MEDLQQDNHRKVFSIQIGPCSNYVSSHFWNSILSEGIGSYFYDSKPVALCIDTKGLQDVTA